MQFLAQPGTPDDGQEIHPQHQDDQHDGGAILQMARLLDGRSGGGQNVDVVRQGHDFVENGGRQFGGEENRAGKHDRRRFTGGPADAQDGAGEDARHGRGQDHPPDGLPLGRPQPQGSLAIGVGHRFQGLFGGTDDHRQGHGPQGQGPGSDAHAHFENDHEKGQAEQAEDHRRNAGQIVDPQADQPHHLARPGILLQVDGRGDANGQGHDDGPDAQTEGAHDTGQDPAFGHGVHGGLGEKVPTDGAPAIGHHEIDNHQQGNPVDRGSAPEKPEENVLDQPAASVVGRADPRKAVMGGWHGYGLYLRRGDRLADRVFFCHIGNRERFHHKEASPTWA
ncbi:hypothetical protein DESC_600104 [Desulfosarcina cetonica]|nr:hypothetical protein DESC_600104 [Desulfosarcina cetonica]